MTRSTILADRERADQRGCAAFTALELEKINEGGFAPHTRERSQVIWKLTLCGLASELGAAMVG